MRGLVSIGVGLELLPVDRVVLLSLILSNLVLDINLFCKSALVAVVPCLSGESKIGRPIKDYDVIVTITEQATIPEV